MRRFSMFLLLATAAVPAMAAADEEDGRNTRQSSNDQSDNRPQRAERAERPQRAERPERAQRVEMREQAQVQSQVQAQPQVQVERRQGGEDNGVFARVRDRRERVEEVQQDGRASRDERMQQWRQQVEERRVAQPSQGGGLVPRTGRYRPVPDINPNVGQPAPENREGRLTTRHDRRDRPQWTTNWHRDNRYDWRRHRDRHRSVFRIGFYYDPFGYSYRRFGLGSYLYPSYYQSNYWISDTWRYRLPPAYGPYRWVRYHNDALLIDTWSGEVVDVIYGFFW